MIGLYAAANYEPQFGPATSDFRGFTLAVNLESFEEVCSVYETLSRVEGVELLDEPTKAFWGGGVSFP